MDTDTEEGHVSTEAETGVMCPQAKEHQGCLQPPEAAREKEGPSPRASAGARLCQRHPDFGPLASRTAKDEASVVVNHPVYGILLQQF